MSPSDLELLKDAFQAAADRDPNPGHIVAHLGGFDLTSQQLADAVRNETLIGRRMVELYEREMAETGTTVKDVVTYLTTGKKPPQLG